MTQGLNAHIGAELGEQAQKVCGQTVAPIATGKNSQVAFVHVCPRAECCSAPSTPTRPSPFESLLHAVPIYCAWTPAAPSSSSPIVFTMGSIASYN